VLLDMAHEKGFKAVVAQRGATALTLVRDIKPAAVTLDLHLPVSGVLPVITESDGSTSVCVTTVTGKIQKFIMRQQSVEEWGLQTAAGVQTA